MLVTVAVFLSQRLMEQLLQKLSLMIGRVGEKQESRFVSVIDPINSDGLYFFIWQYDEVSES